MSQLPEAALQSQVRTASANRSRGRVLTVAQVLRLRLAPPPGMEFERVRFIEFRDGAPATLPGLLSVMNARMPSFSGAVFAKLLILIYMVILFYFSNLQTCPRMRPVRLFGI